MNTKYLVGLSGVIIGILCIMVLLYLYYYGPTSSQVYTSSSCSDGGCYSVTSVVPIKVKILRMVFFVSLAPLFLGIASFIRREHKLVSIGAVCYGFLPLFVMTIPILYFSTILFALTFPVIAVCTYRRAMRFSES